MSVNVQLTSAEIAALVNKYDDLKAAVLAKYLQDNAPTLEITDVVADSSSDSDSTSDASTATADATSTENASS